ncbi:hypothetical protein RB598_009644 [Gaeumannomyces tritici]
MSATAVRGLLSGRCLATRSTRPPTNAVAAMAAVAAAAAAAANPSSNTMAGPTNQGRQQQKRGLHGSAALSARRRPRFKSVQADKMGLTTPEKVDEFTGQHFPDYTEADLARLAEAYGPEQMEALRAGEAAVEARDLTVQGRLRRDPYQLGYVDDLATVRPIVDRRARARPAPDTRSRFMTPDEFTDDFLGWLQGFVPEDVNLEGMSEDELAATIDKYAPSNLDVFKYFNERSSMTDGGRGSNSALAPALMDKVPGVAGKFKRASDPEDRGMDEAGVYQDLKKITGLTVPQMIDMPSKFLVQRTVTNQTRLGKIMSWHVMCMVGNHNGRIGLGEAKSTELMTARTKSRLQAIKSMMPIRRIRPPRVSQSIRDLPPGRHQGPLGAHPAVQVPHEYGQGHHKMPDGPGRPRGHGHRAGPEAGGCEEGLLRGRRVLIMNSFLCLLRQTRNQPTKKETLSSISWCLGRKHPTGCYPQWQSALTWPYTPQSADEHHDAPLPPFF